LNKIKILSDIWSIEPLIQNNLNHDYTVKVLWTELLSEPMMMYLDYIDGKLVASGWDTIDSTKIKFKLIKVQGLVDSNYLIEVISKYLSNYSSYTQNSSI